MDIGINNTAAFFIDDEESLNYVVSGKEITAINARFNERINEISEKLDPVKSELRKAKKEALIKALENIEGDESYKKLHENFVRFNETRENVYKNRKTFYHQTFHKLARRFLEYLRDSGVSELYTSKNLAQLKSEGSKIAKKYRRRFHQIPIISLINFMELNAWEYGIEIHIIDEAYTSRTNVFHNEIKINQEKKREIEKIRKEKPEIADEMKRILGTTHGGRREKGKFIIENKSLKAKNKSYYHSDVGGAANQIQANGVAIEWTNRKKHKLFTPRKISAMKILDFKHGRILTKVSRQDVRSVHTDSN